MVTLEISGADIRILEVTGKKVTGWASASLDPKMFAEGVISDPQALASAVRQLMTASGIKDKNVIASINSLYSLSRVVIVPTAGEQQAAEQAITEAAEAVMPLPGEELYLSWQPIGTQEGSQQVMVIGVPRDVLDSELRTLRLAGINAHVLDLKTLALARVVRRERAIILNIDATSYDIVILVGGFTDVLRTTAWQPEGLSAEEKAEQLISALELTVSFSNTHHISSPLDGTTPLFITGHLSGNLPLQMAIGNGVAYHIEQLSPQLEYPEHLPVSEYAVNIGLAMKTMATPKVNIKLSLGHRETGRLAEQDSFSIPDINLLPQTYKAWRPSARQVYTTLAVVTALVLLVPFYQLTIDAMSDTDTARQKYAAVNTALEKRKAEIAKREPLQKAITQYKAIVAMGGGFVEDLATIRQLTKELDVRVQAISHTGSEIKFNCEAPDYLVFREFINALEKNGRFATPIIPPEGYPYIKGGNIKLTPKR